MNGTCISAQTALMDTGSVASESASFDLCAHLNDTVNMLQELAHAQNLTCSLKYRRIASVRSVGPGKIRQVLINLVANAIKYTDEGTVLVLVKQSRCWVARAVP